MKKIVAHGRGRIAFLFPGIAIRPIGGYKVVYEYANRFAEDGNEVSIIYMYSERIRGIPFWIMAASGLYKERWFYLKNVSQILCKRLTDKFIAKFDKLVATSVKTAYMLDAIQCVPAEKKYYLIQGFEAWGDSSEEYVLNSYRLPLKKMVIAKWLLNKVEYVGECACMIPNGFDFDYFKLSSPIQNRSPYEIAMLYHAADVKRCCDSISALEIVKKRFPNLHVTMFGTEKKAEVPEWFTYFRCPDRERLNAIYNGAAIFVAASSSEGFGLTVGEAMICGCAVACTDNGGFSMMVHDFETGLLSPAFDVKKLADNIIRLIEDEQLRIRLAKSGNDFMQQFSWGASFRMMNQFLFD